MTSRTSDSNSADRHRPARRRRREPPARAAGSSDDRRLDHRTARAAPRPERDTRPGSARPAANRRRSRVSGRRPRAGRRETSARPSSRTASARFAAGTRTDTNRPASPLSRRRTPTVATESIALPDTTNDRTSVTVPRTIRRGLGDDFAELGRNDERRRRVEWAAERSDDEPEQAAAISLRVMASIVRSPRPPAATRLARRAAPGHRRDPGASCRRGPCRSGATPSRAPRFPA